MGIYGAMGEGDLGLGNPDATDEITIAEYLQDAGYNTALLGKWHLGYNLEQSPLHFGFDEFRGMLHGATDYHSHVNTYGRFDWWHNEKPLKEDGYVTDLVTNHSIDLIEGWKEEPFFLLVSHLAIHFPWQTPDDEPQREEGKRYRGGGDEPLSRHGTHSPEEYEEVVIQMIEEIDKSVGRIIKKLHESNLEKNTFVLFISDNGGIIQEAGHKVSSNYPLRGGKQQTYEGGHRVPAIAWWPDKIEGGRITDQTTMTMDMLPTLLEIAGIDKPDQDGPNALDGISLTPILFNNRSLPNRTLFWQHRDWVSGSSAVRSGDWKLVIPNTNSTPELYNLGKDIGENHDLADENPDVVEKLMGEFNMWRQEIEK